MSYEKVKYVSIKNQTICSASNNIRPLSYETFKPFKERISDEQFVKFILVNFLDGNLQGNSKGLQKFNHTIFVYNMTCDKEKEIFDKRCNNYDYKTKTYLYTKEEIKAATEELLDILYSIYLKVDDGYKWNAWDGWVKVN